MFVRSPLLPWFVLLLVAPSGIAAPAPRAADLEAVETSLYFLPSRERDEHVFFARGPGYTLRLEPSGFTLGVRVEDENDGGDPWADVPAGKDPWRKSARWKPLYVEFLDANPAAQAEGTAADATRVHVLKGADSIRDGRRYGRVTYREVYPGIDVAYYGDADGVEYDFLVQPGIDPSVIRMSFKGFDEVRVGDAGTLRATSGGKTFLQHRPIAFQMRDGAREAIEVGYVRLEDGSYGLDLGDYDRERELVIDPLFTWRRVFGSMENSSSDDRFLAVDVGPRGFIYVAGLAEGMDVPLMNPLQGQKGGERLPDAYIGKISPDGKDLVWMTYLGGPESDSASGIKVAPDGSVYVVGTTSNGDFLGTDKVFGPCVARDIFLAKIRRDGGEVLDAARFGSSEVDTAVSLDLSPDNMLGIGGISRGADFPTTDGAFQTMYGGGFSDGVVLMIDEDFDLSYATYLGGDGRDELSDLRISYQHGLLGVSMSTDSAGLPTTTAAYQAEKGALIDAFTIFFDLVNPFSPVHYASYLGGSDNERAWGIEFDPFGFGWLVGRTDSDDFPATPGAMYPDPLGARDAFLARFPGPTAIAVGAPEPVVTRFGNEHSNTGVEVRALADQIIAVATDVVLGGATSTSNCEGTWTTSLVRFIQAFAFDGTPISEPQCDEGRSGAEVATGSGVLAIAGQNPGSTGSPDGDVEGGYDPGGVDLFLFAFGLEPKRPRLEVTIDFSFTGDQGTVGNPKPVRMVVRNADAVRTLTNVIAIAHASSEAPITGPLPGDCNRSGSDLTCDFGELAPRQRKGVTFQVTPASPQDTFVLAEASSRESPEDYDVANLRVTDRVRVRVRAAGVVEGGRLSGVVRLENEGESTATSLEVRVEGAPSSIPAECVRAVRNASQFVGARIIVETICTRQALAPGEIWRLDLPDLTRDRGFCANLAMVQQNELPSRDCAAVPETPRLSSWEIGANGRESAASGQLRGPSQGSGTTVCRGLEVVAQPEGASATAGTLVISHAGRTLPDLASSPPGCAPEGNEIRCAVEGLSAGEVASFPFEFCTDDLPALFTFDARIEAPGAEADANDVTSLDVLGVPGAPEPSVAINPNGVVDAAKFGRRGLKPGMWAALFGTNLADELIVGGFPFPLELDGTVVLVDGRAVPLFFVSPNQIVFQAPWGVMGEDVVEVVVSRNGELSRPERVFSVLADPAIFSLNQSGTGQGSILITGTASVPAPEGSIPGARPVRRGEFISIFALGLGPATNLPPTGGLSPAGPLSETKTAPRVTIGGVEVPVQFSGLAPNLVGLYQVNVQITDAVPTGDAVEVLIEVAGFGSNPVTIAVAP